MKTKLSGAWFAAAVFAFVFAATPGVQAAQGFYLGTGLGFGVPAWEDDIDDLDPEVGLDLEFVHLGYNFTPRWGIGLQWGAVAGDVDDVDSGVYSQGYFMFSGRYTHDTGNMSLIPYAELGLGSYGLLVLGDDDYELAADPVLGVRLAGGAQYYAGNWYLGPELSLHLMEYDDGDFEVDTIDRSVNDLGEGNQIMLLFKFGYHWKR